jgi:hypothetical protein
MKMKTINWKGNLITLGIVGSVLAGAAYINYENNVSKVESSYSITPVMGTTSNNSNDITDQLEVSNVTTFTANTLNDIRGTITNTGNDINDVYGEMAIYDNAGNLIRVKEMHIDSLKSGQSIAFDELVGQYEHAASVKLQQFTE